jgi:enamine deaminase RidA (YjgF/YER057c/UK114 family)
VLEQSGARLEDIVKLAVFLTDISRLPIYRQAVSLRSSRITNAPTSGPRRLDADERTTGSLANPKTA